MKGKTKEVIIVGFILTLFSFGFISAQNCSVVLRSNCADNILMGLSDLTNAHAELATEGNYNYGLCCDFGSGNTTCDTNSTNKVVGLSSSTNAHAEIPEGTNYLTNEVCYDNLECISDTICNSNYSIEMISLSNSANAHAGEFNSYATKICCKTPTTTTPPPVGILPPGAYWANINDPRYVINSIVVVPGSTQVAMILTNAGAPQETLSYEIYEDDSITGDDPIRAGSNSITTPIDEDSVGIAYWTITQEDLDKTFDLDQFFFIAKSEESGDLSITLINGDACVGINYCSDYATQEMCESDTCSVALDSVDRLNPDITCGDNYICECSWNGSSCGAQWTEFNKTVDYNSGGIPGIGICNYIEDTNDDCGDGFLTYSWAINIGWPTDGSNDGWASQLDCINAGGDLNSCLLFDTSIEPSFDGLWHYDPLVGGENPLVSQCHGGSNTVQCPAQMQLPFFTWINFIITLAVLIIAYVIYTSMKKENKKNKPLKKEEKITHK